MVIRLVAVPDYLELGDVDDVFHAVLGWDGGIGYTFQVHGQEFNSFRRRTRAKRLRDFGLHRQEKFQYTLGAIDQWEWEVRVIDQQAGVTEDKTPVCVGGRGATPPQYSGGPTGYRLMPGNWREDVSAGYRDRAMPYAIGGSSPASSRRSWRALTIFVTLYGVVKCLVFSVTM